MGLENAVTIVRALADRSAAPVALHLDHGKSEELARAAVDAGYTSVMIDASRQTYDENMRETAHIDEDAHGRGEDVEEAVGTMDSIRDVGEIDAQPVMEG